MWQAGEGCQGASGLGGVDAGCLLSDVQGKRCVELIVPAGDFQVDGARGLLGSGEGKIAGCLPAEDVVFAVVIVIERAVPIQMVGVEVGERRCVWGPSAGVGEADAASEPVEHEAGEFEDDPVIVVDLVEGVEEASAEVAAEVRALVGVGEDVVQHCRGG